MKPLRLNFDDYMNLRDAHTCGHLVMSDEFRKPYEDNPRPPSMRGRDYRSWKKLQRAGYAEITEALQLRLTSTGKAVAHLARVTEAHKDAMHLAHIASAKRAKIQNDRRGLQLTTLAELGAAAKAKRSVIFEKWAVGPRPAAVVLQMRAAFVLAHLEAGLYLYRPLAPGEKLS